VTARAGLGAHIAARRDYTFWIGMPLARPTAYVRAEPRDGGLAIDGKAVDLDAVTSWLVVYPNGEPLDSAGPALPRPPGVGQGLAPRADAAQGSTEGEILDLATLTYGAKWIRVTYGPSKAKPSSRNDYATTLENVSRERVRVARFCGYRRLQGDRWKLDTVTRELYDAAQFRAWYGLRGEWIEPGGSVTDPDNYGGRPSLWAYFCETEGGERLVAGGVIE
jgi:hypothetical protein